ncbi:TPA: APC family permease [Klebsiella michiganensis]|nr:APC family permease [Klebsiella michiganensis]ELS4625835.1 APC family permease [Klebsiella michiganensis]HCQ8473298.1 APC family permease [Klebsiella michiganensis]HCU0766882.1 APC family permease [Klebsiella michiganensis]HEP0437909.1 APC family permease [Klebsiella michiganensis]
MHNQDNLPELKKSTLTTKDIVFFVVAAAAPLGATVGATPVVFSAGGNSTPLIYLVAAIVLLFFAAGLATVNRYKTSAGGFADIAKIGLGKHAGNAAAGVAVIAYICMLSGLYGQFSVMLSDMIKDLFGFEMKWQYITFIALFLVAILGYRDINFSAKILGILMIFEVLILAIFDVSVFIKMGFSTFQLTNNSTSIPVNSGAIVALMFAMSCFVGFESTTIYGEEAKNPNKTIPLATYISVVIIGFFFIITTYCLNAAYIGSDVSKAATNDMVSFVFNANTQFVGEWSTSLMRVLVVTSIFAVLLSFHNALCRYLFSLGRMSFLNKRLSLIHPKFNSPYVAGIALTITLAFIISIFIISHSDPINQLYMWMVGTGTLGVILLQCLGAFAIAAYFIKINNKHGILGVTFPILSGVFLLLITLYAFINFNLLSGSDAGVSKYLPWILIISGVAGLINGFIKGKSMDIEREPRSV